jgi:glycosyltransferase involved in cell wall biosynthesis
VQEFDLGNRVNFLGWFEGHGDLLKSFEQYRGALLPSLEDANGIIVQEAMAIGLPTICLDWGGPQLLVEHQVTGYLVEPVSQNHIVNKIAEHLDQLSTDGALAERMSLAARATAESWRWSRLAGKWIDLYARLQLVR